MKTKTKVTLAAFALGTIAFAVNAQDNSATPSGGPGPGHHHPPLPIIMALDANHDRVIDSSEIANASAALLTLDKNGDGKLTADEYLPAKPADAPADAPKHPTPKIVSALDANGDGVIDATEIANASAALKTLDTNGDGQLTADEFAPRPPKGDNATAMNGPDDAPPGPPPAE